MQCFGWVSMQIFYFCVPLGSILFLGGWLSPIEIYPFNLLPGAFWMIFKILGLFILFSLIKAIVPRYRFDPIDEIGLENFSSTFINLGCLNSKFFIFFRYVAHCRIIK